MAVALKSGQEVGNLALRNLITKDVLTMSNSIVRRWAGKLAFLTLAGTLAVLFTASLVSAHADDQKDEGKDKGGADVQPGPRAKKGSLIRSGYTRPGTPNDIYRTASWSRVPWNPSKLANGS